MVDFDETCIKIFGLERFIQIDLVSFYIAFPFNHFVVGRH